MEKRIVKLPKGGDLEISLTPEFLSVLSKHFNLPSPSHVNDDHIRMFVYGSLKSALDSAEENHSK